MTNDDVRGTWPRPQDVLRVYRAALHRYRLSSLDSELLALSMSIRTPFSCIIEFGVKL